MRFGIGISKIAYSVVSYLFIRHFAERINIVVPLLFRHFGKIHGASEYAHRRSRFEPTHRETVFRKVFPKSRRVSVPVGSAVFAVLADYYPAVEIYSACDNDGFAGIFVSERGFYSAYHSVFDNQFGNFAFENIERGLFLQSELHYAVILVFIDLIP